MFCQEENQGGVDLGDKQKKPHTLDIAAAIKGVPNITHKKGLEYFFWERLDILVFDDSLVHATVRGSGDSSYDVDIAYSLRDGKVIGSGCTCPAYRSYPGPCKHIIATLYAMKSRLDKGFEPPARVASDAREPARRPLPEDEPPGADPYEAEAYGGWYGEDGFDGETGGKRVFGEPWADEAGWPGEIRRKRVTSYAAKQLLDRSVTKLVGKAESESARAEPVGLEPTFHMDYHDGVNLRFKVGASRKYVVKDLVAFKEGFYINARFNLGKSSRFVLNRNSFDDDSLPLLDFFISRYTPFVDRYGYYEKKRQWNLSYEQTEDFFDLIEGGSVDTEIFGEKRRRRVARGNYPVKLKVERADGGVRLTSEERYEIIPGAGRTLVVTGDAIHICSQEYAEVCEDLLSTLFEAGGELFFAKEDVQASLGAIAGRAESFLDIEYVGGIEDEAPPPLVTKVYFDSGDDGSVTARVTFSYGDSVRPAFGKKDYREAPDMAAEVYAENTLKKYMGETRAGDGTLVLAPEKGFDEKLYDLVARGVDEIRSFAEVYASDAFNTIKVRQPATATVGVRVEGDLLRVDFDVEGIDYAELAEVINSYKRAKKYHRLRDGSLLPLEDDSIAELSEIVSGLDIPDRDIAKGAVRLDANRSLYIDAMMKKSEELRYRRDARFRGIIRSMRDVSDADFVVPEHLDSVLRNYQKTGYEWLRTLDALSFGGILADDMGLGKTLQVLALLQAVKDEAVKDEAVKDEAVKDEAVKDEAVKDEAGAVGETQAKGAGAADGVLRALPRPSIVVCPASLVLNWESEAAKFTPRLNTIAVTGSVAERGGQIREARKRDVVFTSYDLLKRDIEHYEKMAFRFVIIDEAQYIKNQNTQNAKSVKRLRGGSRIALTGTPVENSLAELWSIFDFLMPGYLYSYGHFRSKYETRITKKNDAAAQERLRTLVRPFILRRLKSNVLKELPEKIESVSYSTMNDGQRRLYLASMSQAREDLSGRLEAAGAAQSRIMILAALMRLRQICCDPSLVFDDYADGSAKLDACMELVESCVDGGHRILLFSQFTSMLSIIEERLREGGVPYYTLTGSTPKTERMRLVNSFNEGDTPVFLISLKAGGTGLNLPGADIVIHYDPWWNVSAQNQATDRAHRIGQTNVVQVFKLIAKDSVEERILEMQAKKAALADAVIEEGGGELSALTEEELLSLFSE